MKRFILCEIKFNVRGIVYINPYSTQTCRGTGFGIGPNPCSAWPDTKTRPYFDISDTSQSMYRPRPIHGPIPKHGRTFGSPIPPNPCTEHPIPKPQTHTVDYILVQIMFTVVYILTYEFRK